MAEHLTIPGALEWDTVERHSIATLRYAGGKEHEVKYVSEVAYDALKAERDALREEVYRAQNPPFNGRLDTWQAACGKARGETEVLHKRLTVALNLLREIRQSCEMSKLRDAQVDAVLDQS